MTQSWEEIAYRMSELVVGEVGDITHMSDAEAIDIIKNEYTREICVIEAALDMLKALELCVEKIEYLKQKLGKRYPLDLNPNGIAENMARAAIKKAEG